MAAVGGTLAAPPWQMDINTAEADSCMDSQEKSVKKSNFLGWRPIRDLLASVPKKYSHGEAPDGELLENYNCVDEKLKEDLDSHSSTSESSWCDDADRDPLDSDWETSTPPPIAELKNDAQYEIEDWDQELSDACPYDCDDTLEINSQQNILYVPSFCEENTIYDPSCHHAENVTTNFAIRYSQVGQFDDADE